MEHILSALSSCAFLQSLSLLFEYHQCIFLLNNKIDMSNQLHYKYSQISEKSSEKISFIFVKLSAKFRNKSGAISLQKKSLRTTASIKPIQIQNKTVFEQICQVIALTCFIPSIFKLFQYYPSRHGCIADTSLRRLMQRLRDNSKRADLQISETSAVRCIKDVSSETSRRSLRSSQGRL